MKDKLKLIGAMGIFGTVGIFVRYIPLPSATIAFFRSVLALAFLLPLVFITGKKVSIGEVWEKLPLLCLSGVALGGNWILLFEAYRYTTVATATVCYYLAPMFLLLASPLLGEKLTGRKLLCIGTALLGMVCLSGILKGGIVSPVGLLFALGAAVLYATVVFLNRLTGQVESYTRTIVQMATAAVVIFVYMLCTGQSVAVMLTNTQWILLMVVGIVDTGVAYAMYFGSVKDLPTQTVAVFSYLDPVISVLLSALVLREKMDLFGIIGTVMILGSALYSELDSAKKVGID